MCRHLTPPALIALPFVTLHCLDHSGLHISYAFPLLLYCHTEPWLSRLTSGHDAVLCSLTATEQHFVPAEVLINYAQDRGYTRLLLHYLTSKKRKNLHKRKKSSAGRRKPRSSASCSDHSSTTGFSRRDLGGNQPPSPWSLS